jgi:hypothetical protein
MTTPGLLAPGVTVSARPSRSGTEAHPVGAGVVPEEVREELAAVRLLDVRTEAGGPWLVGSIHVLLTDAPHCFEQTVGIEELPRDPVVGRVAVVVPVVGAPVAVAEAGGLHPQHDQPGEGLPRPLIERERLVCLHA